MPTYSATLVRKPRRVRYCDMCNTMLYEHLRLFGCGCAGDKPYVIRVCLACGGTTCPKIRKALGIDPISFPADSRTETAIEKSPTKTVGAARFELATP